jgi:hypothetical protein
LWGGFLWGVKPPQTFIVQRAIILFEGEVFFVFSGL